MKKLLFSVFTFAFAGIASAQGDAYALSNIGKEVSLKDISSTYSDCNCYVLDTTFFLGQTAGKTAVRRSGHLSDYTVSGSVSATRGVSASADAGWTVASTKITLNKPCYYLPGTVHVDSGVTFTIPAGTIIYGSKLTFSAFVQLPGSTVMAKGTASDPIVFTSARSNRGRGDWGGVVIAGRAPIAGDVSSFNATSRGNLSYIEGLPKAAPYLVGGTRENDNSGMWTWVQSNYAGLNVGAQGSGNELNSFSLYGVGNATKMNNLQVAYANDDAIEIFGGSVNISNAFILNTLDDDIDLDGGYQGTIQNVLVYRLDTASRDVSRSRLAEISNKNVYHVRRTMPVITNVTAFGARAIVGKTYTFGRTKRQNWNFTGDSMISGVVQYLPASSNLSSMTGFSIDKNASARIFNSIIYGYDQAFNVSDTQTVNNFAGVHYTHDSAWGPQFAYNAWGNCVSDMTAQSGYFKSGNTFPYDNTTNWIRYFQASNLKANSDNIQNVGYNVTVGQGVYPAITSLTIYGAHKTQYGNLANALIKFGSGFGSNDTLDARVTKKQAANMAQRGVMASKLTGFNINTDEDYCGTGLPFGGNNNSNEENNNAELAAASLELFAINPSEGAINVVIEDAKSNQMSDVQIYDMSGKLVKSTVVTGKDINVTGMPVGLYTVVVNSNNSQESIKVFVK